MLGSIGLGDRSQCPWPSKVDCGCRREVTPPWNNIYLGISRPCIAAAGGAGSRDCGNLGKHWGSVRRGHSCPPCWPMCSATVSFLCLCRAAGPWRKCHTCASQPLLQRHLRPLSWDSEATEPGRAPEGPRATGRTTRGAGSHQDQGGERGPVRPALQLPSRVSLSFL